MVACWSCSDLGVDPRFAFQTILQPTFGIPASTLPSSDTSITARVWVDPSSLTAEDRGAGVQGADVDSSYVQRVYIHSTDSSWSLANLSSAWIAIGPDTIATASIPNDAGNTYVFPRTSLTAASRNVAIVPGDSVDVRLGYTLRNSTQGTEQITAGITIETIARAKFQ